MVALLDKTTLIQAIREADLNEITAIEQRAYEYPWTRQIFHDCLRTGYTAFALKLSTSIIGYYLLSIAAGEAHVLNLCVDPKEQGKGYGRRLIEHAIKLARWHRSERIFLEVRPSNQPAIKLYDGLGFNEIGRRPNYYPTKNGREDALIMALELLPAIT